MMYQEVDEYLRKIEDLLPEINLSLLNEIEHILFETWETGYECGYQDARE